MFAALWCAVAAQLGAYGGAFETSTSPTFAAPLCPICAYAVRKQEKERKKKENSLKRFPKPPPPLSLSLSLLVKNAATGACGCPVGSEYVQAASVLNDCAQGQLRPALLGLCRAGDLAAARAAAFGGAYQLDDAVPDGLGCRSPNPFTDACSCPAGFAELRFRALAPFAFPSDGSMSPVGSALVLCAGTVSSSGAGPVFAGAFQHDDPVAGGLGCRVPHASTGNCSCPAATQPTQQLRVIVDGATVDDAPVVLGSMLTLCTTAPPPAPVPPPVTICSGVTADPSGQTDAAAALQRCIDQGAPDLELPPGTYAITTGQLNITRPLVLRTAGVAATAPGCGRPDGPRCAVLRASRALFSAYGVLEARNTTGVVLDHVVLDGNRGARDGTPAAAACSSPDRGPAYNA